MAEEGNSELSNGLVALGQLASPIAIKVAKAAIDGGKGPVSDTISDIWGGLVGDRIRQWRQRNLVATLERTASFLREKGIDLSKAHALPDGALYAIFDGASKADAPSVQNIWASLLAGQMSNVTMQGRLDPYVIQALSGMTNEDAQVLNLVMSSHRLLRSQALRSDKALQQALRTAKSPGVDEDDKRRALRSMAMREAQISKEISVEILNKWTELKKIGIDEVNLSRDKLVRLGLIGRLSAAGVEYVPVQPILLKNLEKLPIEFIINHLEQNLHRSLVEIQRRIDGGNGDAATPLVYEGGGSSPKLTYSLTKIGERFAALCETETGE